MSAFLFLIMAAQVLSPGLTSMEPASGVRETSLTVTLTGANFAPGMTINAGFGIAVSNIVVIDSTLATADFAIAANAPLGIHNVTVTSEGGSGSLNTFSVLPPPPSITAINPSTGNPGSALRVTLTGTNFVLGFALETSGDITVTGLSLLNATTAAATFAIAPEAALGERTVTMTTRGGVSEPVPFTIVAPSAPTLTEVSPATGVQDSRVNVTLTGTNFLSDLTIEAPSGVTVSNLSVVNSTRATATFAIAGDAASGAHAVRVTTSYGASQTVPFSISPVPPSISAITPGSGIVGTVVNVALSGTNFTSTLAVEALPGITVSNLTVVDSVSASATFTIESAAAAGTRDVRLRTAWGTSAAAAFTVLPLAPTLTGVNPASAILNTLVAVTLTGTNFVPGMTVDAGADITVSDVIVVNSTTATVALAIGPAAGVGERAITVTAAGGTTAAVTFTVLPPPPQLTGIDPATIVQGTRTSTYFFTLTGTNFFGPRASVSGADISVGGIEASSATSAALMLIVAPNAATGTREIRVTTSGGTSEPVFLTLLPPIPTLTGMTPSIVAKGHSVRVMLTGTNFVGGLNLNSIPGITIGDVTVVDETTLYAVFTIASNATSGVRNVTVTTPRGTSSAVAFTVVDPFPDLSVAVSAGKFGIGFNGAYELAVSNVGTAATSGEIVINAALPVDLSFMYAAGTGWTCSAAGPAVTCRNTGRLAPGASSTLTLTVAVESKAAATANHTISVSTAGDLNAANNSATNVTTVSPSPFPQLVFSPRTVTPGQQAAVAVRLDSPFPHDVTGTLTLGFTPNAIALLDDPAIQFATGGRAVRFTVHANDLQATFEDAAHPGPIGFQAGTLAGALIFRGKYAVGNIQGSFPSLGFDTLRITPQAPTIHEIRTSTDGGFAASVVVSSTSREMTQLSLTFNTDQSVRLSCGTTAGCTLSDKTLTFDVSALFSEWFATDSMLGSLTLLRLPLNIAGGTVTGSVAVTLSNTYGASNSMSFNLP